MPRRALRVRPAVLAGLLLTACASRAEPDVGSLVDAVVQAYGGPAAVAKLAAFRVEGEVEALMRSRNGTLRRDFVAPDRLHVAIAYPRVTEVRILDSARGWRGDAEHQAPVRGMAHTAMVYQLLRATVPWSLVHHRARLELREVRTDGEAPLRVLRLTWAPDLRVEFLVDEKTRRVVGVEGTLSMGQQSMPFATRYSDFRMVDGVLVPHSEESFAGGRHTATTRLTAVRFSPPDLGPFAPDER